MFVPRQVQKKPAQSKRLTTTPNLNLPPLAVIPPQRTGIEQCVDGDVDIKVAREIVMALEMLLSDYSMENVYGNWLRERMRGLEGKDDFIHLSTFVDCQFLAKVKPKLSQLSFAKALVACESDMLELSADKYHVRRKAKPSPFGDMNQDEFTIYIEPNLTNVSQNPGRVARVLSEAQLPRKYLPVQFVESAEKSWAFIILSSAISQADATEKAFWPKDWIVLAKSEWQRRDAEYQELRGAVRRVQASYPPGLPQEMGGVIHPRAVKVEPRSRTVVSSKGTLSDGGSCPHRDDTGASGFEVGLIVRLTNLHPSTTKATISSFVCRSVDRYIRKKTEKQGKKKSGVVIDQVLRSVKINYVDYEKGLGQAYIRQRSQEDSGLIAIALQKRKRKMRDGEDTKGEKVTKACGQDWVKGKVLTGEEEKIYWERLLSAKETKDKRKGIGGRKEGHLVTSDLRRGIKRARQDSEASNPWVGKHIKFD